ERSRRIRNSWRRALGSRILRTLRMTFCLCKTRNVGDAVLREALSRGSERWLGADRSELPCTPSGQSEAPDDLGRPAAGPFVLVLAEVGGLRTLRGLELQQVFDDESVAAKQADPLAVG